MYTICLPYLPYSLSKGAKINDKKCYQISIQSSFHINYAVATVKSSSINVHIFPIYKVYHFNHLFLGQCDLCIVCLMHGERVFF